MTLDSISICTCVIGIISSNLITNPIFLCTQPVMWGIAVFKTSDICGRFVEIEIMYDQYINRQKLCIDNTYVKRPLSLATRTVVNRWRLQKKKYDVCIKLYTLYNLNLFFNLCAKSSTSIRGSTFFPTSHKSGQWKAWILKEKAENKNVSWVHSALYLTVLECWTSWSLKGQEETSQLSGLFWRLTWKYTSFWWLPLSAKKKRKLNY